MKILVTGFAGFIGFHVTQRLIKDITVKKILAIDNLNNYYDVKLKKERINILKRSDVNSKLVISKIDINNFIKLNNIVNKYKIDHIIHLAAQAGVRYSFTNPRSYIESNINGFFNILEISKNLKLKKLIYASSSSVYGKCNKTPFTEDLRVNQPLQLYASTKISNEVMAYAYSHLYKINTFGLRFFTVYGPYGRPDMAIYKFVDSIYNNKKINLFSNGLMKRDFTFIDDVVEGIFKILKGKISKKKENSSNHIYNIGRGKPIQILKLIKKLEKICKKKARLSLKKNNDFEMKQTYCSIKKLKKDFNYSPVTDLDKGLKEFDRWYKKYNRLT